mmetsp:Transcript_130940/g.252283  ORF Transcript_130940/g.252283 Transcript_130940/m.252283 type:complete len:278 (-) Transcript_130940:123-956(-)
MREPLGLTSMSLPPFLRRIRGSTLAGATRQEEPTMRATLQEANSFSAFFRVAESNFSPKYVASGFRRPVSQDGHVGAPGGATGDRSPRGSGSGEEEEDEDDDLSPALAARFSIAALAAAERLAGAVLAGPDLGDWGGLLLGGGEGDDDEDEESLLLSSACFPSLRRIVDTSGNASSTIWPCLSSHPTLLKASVAGHVLPQRKHTPRVSFPCSSKTFLLPAAVCKPSTFCVTTPAHTPLSSSSANATCPGFGRTPSSRRKSSISNLQQATGSRRKFFM